MEPLVDVAVSSSEADVQRRQAEDLPAIGLRGDNHDAAAGRRVQRLDPDPAAVLDVGFDFGQSSQRPDEAP